MGLLDRVKASQAAVEVDKEVLVGAASTSIAAAAGATAVAAPPRPRPAAHPEAPGSGVVVELAPRQAAARQAAAEADAQPAGAPAPATGPVSGRAGASWVSAKAQIHARLVEKYADEIDVTD